MYEMGNSSPDHGMQIIVKLVMGKGIILWIDWDLSDYSTTGFLKNMLFLVLLCSLLHFASFLQLHVLSSDFMVLQYEFCTLMYILDRVCLSVSRYLYLKFTNMQQYIKI